MISKILISLVALFTCMCVYAQSVNTNISNGLAFDGEPYLAINPTNNQNLVAAWMGIKLSSGQYRIAIKTRASFDGGLTWSAANSLPHFGSGFGSADVSMAFDRSGLLYLAYIDYKQAPDSGGIYVTRSVNGGLQWDQPSKAFDMYDVPNKRPIDRPWLVVDNSNNANSGTLYITTKPAPWIGPPNRPYFKVSTDKGFTWSSISTIDGGTHLVGSAIGAPMATPAVTANGTFCVVYPSYVPAQTPLPTFYLATSNNRGNSFSYSTVYSAIPVQLDTNFKSGYTLLTHPSDSSKMLFIQPNASSGDVDIIALHSNNSGQSWSSPIRVNDDPFKNGKAQDMPWGAYNERGDVVVSWRDRRNSTADGFWNAGYDFYYATSNNNGQSFSASKKLNTQFISFDSILTQSGNDFMCCVYKADTLYAVWGDSRSGKMNIYFTKTIASTNTSVGVFELDGDEQPLKLSKHIVDDYLMLSLSPEFIGKELFIYDSRSKLLSSQTIAEQNVTIDTRVFSHGVFLLRVGNASDFFVKP